MTTSAVELTHAIVNCNDTCNHGFSLDELKRVAKSHDDLIFSVRGLLDLAAILMAEVGKEPQPDGACIQARKTLVSAGVPEDSLGPQVAPTSPGALSTPTPTAPHKGTAIMEDEKRIAKKTCKTCLFWVNTGNCRRYPPTLGMHYATDTYSWEFWSDQPAVDHDYWCGEYKAKDSTDGR